MKDVMLHTGDWFPVFLVLMALLFGGVLFELIFTIRMMWKASMRREKEDALRQEDKPKNRFIR